MMSRAQISLDAEVHRQARERASELGISFAEYVRRLLVRDLREPEPQVDPSRVFCLGDSGGSDIAREKHEMLGEAVATSRRSRD